MAGDAKVNAKNSGSRVELTSSAKSSVGAVEAARKARSVGQKAVANRVEANERSKRTAQRSMPR